MSLVINYDGGRFVLPKIDYPMRFRYGDIYIPSTEARDSILAKAIQIPIDNSEDFYLNHMTEDNIIGTVANYGYVYKTSEPYKLKNGWELYLNATRYQSGTDKPLVCCYVLHNPTTKETLWDASSGATPQNTTPIMYMFEDSTGAAYITPMSPKASYYHNGNYYYSLFARIADYYENTKRYFELIFVEVDSDDPYYFGGESGQGGGTGTFSDTGDNIEIPTLPALSAVNTGFITLFSPTIGQLYELAGYIWSDLFDLEAWKKIFADPMDAILGMSIVPVNVPAGATTPVTVGNISTGVSMTRAASQFVSVDCGTLNVKEFWGAYLDYDPYTKAEIYLPYIGTHALAVDDIMNKSVHVVYHVDILSGACCAYVKCGGSVLYTFVGQCSCSIPITGNDWTNVINGALSIATAIGSMVATGGASAPLTVSSVASTAINSMKPNVEKSGSLGGMGGMMGVQTPYLILTRPRQVLPKHQNKYMGYPSFITSKLSELSGYTEIENIHLDNIPATEQELSEIETLLKGGVIL